VLTPEAAQEQLEQWHAEDKTETRYVPAVAELPPAERSIGYVLAGRRPDGEEYQLDEKENPERDDRDAAAALDAMSTPQRLRLLAVFFPQLADSVEYGWQLLRKFPYQRGWFRRAFRAPSLPAASQGPRFAWLRNLITSVQPFQQEVVTPGWLATWAAHLPHRYYGAADELGRLFGAVIDGGGPQADELYEILRQSACNEHEIGAMGRHVPRALLMANRPDGWEFIEKMLLAAQRQEGLRQSILEAVDECHPQAFRRMLGLLCEQKLTRFAAVVRAANVWFGLSWDVTQAKQLHESLEHVLRLLDDEGTRDKALQGNDPEKTFLALWSLGFADALSPVPVAEGLLDHAKAEMRYVAAVHLSQLGLPQADRALARALDDKDLRVAYCALASVKDEAEMDDDGMRHSLAVAEGTFERLERLFARLPEKPQSLEPLVWPWTAIETDRDRVAWCLVSARGKRPPRCLVPYLPRVGAGVRRQIVEVLAAQDRWDEITRETIVELAGDASAAVRSVALAALAKVPLKSDQVLQLESLLSRKSGDLRRGMATILLAQNDGEALASADRLAASTDGQKRLAGLELLRQMAEANRQRTSCQRKANVFAAARKKLTNEEQTQLRAIAAAGEERLTLENALGLMDPAERTPGLPPQRRDVQFITDAAVRCLKALDELVDQHREETISFKSYGDEKQDLLGNAGWEFPTPDREKPPEKAIEDLPLRDVWLRWYEDRPAALRDGDGLELVRAALWVETGRGEWHWRCWQEWATKSEEHRAVVERLCGEHDRASLRYQSVVDHLLQWLLFLHPIPNASDNGLDILETTLALIPEAEMREVAEPRRPDFSHPDWRTDAPFVSWGETMIGHCTEPMNREQVTRYWRLLRWRDEPVPGAPRQRPDVEILASAYAVQGATLADWADHLLGVPDETTYRAFGTLSSLTEPKPNQWAERVLTSYPEVRELINRCRERILEIELARGEAVTPATQPAMEVQSLYGTPTLVRLLGALGKTGFKVGSPWRSRDNRSKAEVLTHLASVTYPAADDTPEQFAAQVKKAIADGLFPEERVLELAFLAPQWSRFIEQYLRWPGFVEGLYWFLAHMKYVWGATTRLESSIDGEPAAADAVADGAAEEDGSRRQESAWDRIIHKRTPLSDDERSAGAIDMAWFQRTYAQLTPQRWQAMADAAKFAANAAQARKAQFIAEVLRGKASRRELLSGVKKKKLKEYVRLLGLLPLAKGMKREADLTERYGVLQEYRRYAKQLSAMAKPDALQAVEIGLDNLARTAGYPDPLRLEWAMEAKNVRDLAGGPVSVSRSGVTVTLFLDHRAQPQLTICRGEKELKAIPPALKKDKKIEALTERVKDLRRQASRMRESLETAMCRGDEFTGAELGKLCGHAILVPMLERLVLVGDKLMGYPARQGKALRDYAGKLHPVKKTDGLRIAHPCDLLQSGRWDAWQHECFAAERIQPFKQVFRELYAVTKQEQRDKMVSRRYAGQQVNERQANALWGQRGWHTQYGVWKTFYELGVTASVSFKHGYTTPLEVEGLTIDEMEFRHRDQDSPLKLADVPPRVFSEVMRDLDLVVSVAHVGGVDPEASASTVEMRATLLRETCQLLGLDNVRIKNSHALVDGELAKYNVHLGSATVHRMPGGSLCIVPVHAQHRGRLFLPFADDDPRTAEVVSKVMLLARDAEIQDPTILEQLRR
jgi:hypothetical protein